MEGEDVIAVFESIKNIYRFDFDLQKGANQYHTVDIERKTRVRFASNRIWQVCLLHTATSDVR